MEEKKVSILIIEDDPDVLDFILMVLDEIEADFEIHTASDHETITHAVDTLVPDMIILDLMMPGTTGFVVCKNYRQRHGSESTKVLAITGYDTPENKERIMECGANDYLAKPFSFDAIKDKIRQLLGLTG